MSEVYLAEYRITDKERWLGWCKELDARKKEVLETLKNEKTLSESCFISKDERYIFYFIEAENLSKALEIASASKFVVDKEHMAAFNASLERVEVFRNLFHFENRA
jgi:uncharacterized protein YlbG (UPF0298 family)